MLIASPQGKKPEPRVLDAYIMFGQSNMEGGDNTGTIPAEYQGSINTCYAPINRANVTNLNNYELNYLRFGINQNWNTPVRTTYCGPELAFAKDYTTATGKNIVLIKFSSGGSAMVDNGSPTPSGLWQWDANPANLPSGVSYFQVLRDLYIIASINRFRARGIELNFKAIIQDQGETDMLDSTRANNYQTVCTAFYNKLIEGVTPYSDSFADIKVVIIHTGGPLYTNIANRTYYSQVRTAQQNVVTTFNGLLVSKDALAPGTDGVHEDRAVQCAKGSLLSTALVSAGI